MAESPKPAAEAAKHAGDAPKKGGVNSWLADDMHKILLITAVAGLVVTCMVIGVVAMLVRPPPVQKPSASAAAASSAKTHPEHSAPVDNTEAIRREDAQRQKAIDAQVALLRQQNISVHSAAPISAGERDCKLSGDPQKRDDELRACFGLPSIQSASEALAAATQNGAPAAESDNSLSAGLPGGVWGYTGRAASEYWSADPRNALCGSGHQQSPINILGKFDGGTPILTFSYRDEPLRMINTGTTIRVNVPPGSEIQIANVTFQLVAIEFHTPAEEWINGHMADMSFDFIHKNNNGQVAVITVLVNRGVEHPALKSLWDWLPDEVGSEQIFPDNRFDPNKILPADRGKYWYYQGSLSSPPCTEGVQRFVLKQSISISDAQFQRFTALYPFNARPVQPLYGRLVRER